MKLFAKYIIVLVCITALVSAVACRRHTFYPIAVAGRYNCIRHDYFSDPADTGAVNYDTVSGQALISISGLDDTSIAVDGMGSFRCVYADSSKATFSCTDRSIPQFAVFFPQRDSIYLEDPGTGGEGLQSGYYYVGRKQ